jgi:hypothetical protein
LAAYASSKYNLILLGAALRNKLSASEVTIHNVHPGLVDTPMLQNFFSTNINSRNSTFHPIMKFAQNVQSKISQNMRNFLLLTPQEAAIHVLNAAYAPSPSSSKIPYFINGIHSPDRLSQRLMNNIDEQAQLCFEDAVKVLPSELCRIAIDRLQNADLVTADISPQLRQRRLEAMKLLGVEIQSIRQKIQ